MESFDIFYHYVKFDICVTKWHFCRIYFKCKFCCNKTMVLLLFIAFCGEIRVDLKTVKILIFDNRLMFFDRSDLFKFSNIFWKPIVLCLFILLSLWPSSTVYVTYYQFSVTNVVKIWKYVFHRSSLVCHLIMVMKNTFERSFWWCPALLKLNDQLRENYSDLLKWIIFNKYERNDKDNKTWSVVCYKKNKKIVY